MSAAWKITEDKISDGDLPTRVGWGQGTLSPDDVTYEFKLYDDDGEHYYSGVCNAESYGYADDGRDGSLYNAWRWAETDAGATDLRMKLVDLERIHGAESSTAAIFRDKIARLDGWCSIFG